jgi:Phospholipase B
VCQPIVNWALLPPWLRRLEEQDRWVREEISKNSTAYWTVLDLVMAQFDGLIRGYQVSGLRSLTLLCFWI